MTFLGSILLNGMGYAVYGPRGTTIAQVWERHILVAGTDQSEVLLANDCVRLVALSEDPPLDKLPDEYSDARYDE